MPFLHTAVGMPTLLLLMVLSFLLRLHHVHAYPQGSLRNNYCVKEVSSLPISLCGKTQYYGDSYVNGECVYKKCDSECVPGKFTFTWDSQQYTRRRYCCNDVNLCNAASSLVPFAMTSTVFVAALALLAFIMH